MTDKPGSYAVVHRELLPGAAPGRLCVVGQGGGDPTAIWQAVLRSPSVNLGFLGSYLDKCVIYRILSPGGTGTGFSPTDEIHELPFKLGTC